MTITEFLDDPHCIFCDKKLTMSLEHTKDTFICVDHQSSITGHKENAIWQFRGTFLNAINIIIDEFHVCWDLRDNSTQIIDRRNGTSKIITEFDHLLELPLKPERLLAKIKTIAVFS